MSIAEILSAYDKIRSEKKQEIPESRLKTGKRWENRYKRPYKRSDGDVKNN